MKIVSKQNVDSMFVDLLLAWKFTATLPLASVEEWPRSLFYRNFSSKIKKKNHFSYSNLED